MEIRADGKTEKSRKKKWVISQTKSYYSPHMNSRHESFCFYFMKVRVLQCNKATLGCFVTFPTKLAISTESAKREVRVLGRDYSL